MQIQIMEHWNNKFKQHNKIFKNYNKNMIKKVEMIYKMISLNN